MSILIGIAFGLVVIHSYTHTHKGLLVRFELASQQPKVIGAVRADLTSNTRCDLQLNDEQIGHHKMVSGTGRSYLNLVADGLNWHVKHQARAQHL